MRNRISEYSDFATEHVDIVLTLYTFIQKVPGYPDISFFMISHSLSRQVCLHGLEFPVCCNACGSSCIANKILLHQMSLNSI